MGLLILNWLYSCCNIASNDEIYGRKLFVKKTVLEESFHQYINYDILDMKMLRRILTIIDVLTNEADQSYDTIYSIRI